MSDTKYGRLFTEADVTRIVGVARHHEMPASAAIEFLDKLGGPHGHAPFPADEPLFLLRGQDRAAVPAITGPGNYYDAAKFLGASAEHLDAVVAAARAIKEWQAANPGRVKVPD